MITGPGNIEGRKLIDGEQYSLFMLQLVFPRLQPSDCHEELPYSYF